jgi:hypothetical protein
MYLRQNPETLLLRDTRAECAAERDIVSLMSLCTLSRYSTTCTLILVERAAQFPGSLFGAHVQRGANR